MEILSALKALDRAQGPLAGWKEAFMSQLRGEVRVGEPMKNHTSIKIGGKADLLIIPEDLADLKTALGLIKAYQVSWMVVGLGSNLLVRDGGIRGVVFKLTRALNYFELVEETSEAMWVKVGAGFPLPKVVEFAKNKGLKGLEYLYGIPGNMGGSLKMNAGTTKGEIKNIVDTITFLSEEGECFTQRADQLKFEYRHLKTPPHALILEAKLRLMKGDVSEITERLGDYRKYRHETQPLDSPNCGSVFKNPPKQHAARLIEEAGLKDVRGGGARISPKHGNFIVNEGNATASDVLALIALIKDKVREIFDVKLELEVKIVGEE